MSNDSDTPNSPPSPDDRQVEVAAAASAVDPEILRRVFQDLSLGCVIADYSSWEIMFENATFFQWFPPKGEKDSLLTERLPKLNQGRAEERLKNGRPLVFEAEIKPGAKEIPLEIELRPIAGDDSTICVVECRDISKRRQAEYMLESYSKIAEKNARDLQRERDRVEKLLLNIMPRSVYDEMKDYGTVTPQRFDQASIVMLDFVDFTDMAISRDPTALIAELNDIFTSVRPDRGAVWMRADQDHRGRLYGGFWATGSQPGTCPERGPGGASNAPLYRTPKLCP